MRGVGERNGEEPIVGPVDALAVPRFAGPATFARLPTLEQVGRAAVAIVGVPFDSGVVYRPGARFGPAAIRAGSKLLRPYNAWTGVLPFGSRQVADAGDIACTPFGIEQAIGEIERAATATFASADHLIALGGDHTIALPLLRAAAARFGPVAIVHFDAHLDTWDTYFGELVHPRHAVSPGVRGGADRLRAVPARRRPRTVVRRHRPGRQ